MTKFDFYMSDLSGSGVGSMDLLPGWMTESINSSPSECVVCSSSSQTCSIRVQVHAFSEYEFNVISSGADYTLAVQTVAPSVFVFSTRIGNGQMCLLRMALRCLGVFRSANGERLEQLHLK